MARTWLSVTVELLGGRGEELWPPPGRVLAVGPAHTFRQLADAINGAFARWDRAHLSLFTLGDGRVVTDGETGEEMAAGIWGPVTRALDIETTKVVQVLEPGAELMFTFDLGDGWTHRCVVGEEKVDPVEVLGVRATLPLPYWGWGALPDQYGRRWEGDDGAGRAPARPARPHPMLRGSWPASVDVPELDLSVVRSAVAAGDPDGFLAAVVGRDVGEALQQLGEGLVLALDGRRAEAEDVVASIVSRLHMRGLPGDEVLAADLVAELRGDPLAGRVVPVDLEMLAAEMEGDPAESGGGYVDLHTGEVWPEAAADAATVGEDAAIDVETDPGRWLWFDRTGSRDGWQDMAAFAEQQRDPGVRQRLERAIEGKGAFRRFRDVLHESGLVGQWSVYSSDRTLGRARAFLADAGIRVGRTASI